MAEQPTPAPIHARPTRVTFDPLPPIPVPDPPEGEHASTEYSHYRTGLSRHRTGLSEHRTDLSEFRTDLSTDRTEMSMRRTGMSFQRTRMSTDRTLMSIVRTSLSLIGFGFTIFQFFGKMVKTPGFELGANAPRNFGIALVALGILLLMVGIIYHARYMHELRLERTNMIREGLIHGQSAYPVSPILICAVVLLFIGLMAIASMVFDVKPFG